MKVKTRKWAGFAPAWGWALVLDGLDFIGNIISAILTAVFGIGIVVDIVFDAIQFVLAFLIFDNVYMWGANAGEAVLPPIVDIFPANVAMWVYLEKMTKK